jgi:hypothetical protein
MRFHREVYLKVGSDVQKDFGCNTLKTDLLCLC